MNAAQSMLISHRSRDIAVEVVRGHFATGHSHVNYYINLTHAKDRHRMAKEIAFELSVRYASIPVDTVICRDGTKMIGSFIADALTQQGIMMINYDADINVITPERDNGGHLIFRENNLEMVSGKNVLMLVSSVSTGRTVNLAMDCLKYYGGNLAGVCALFSIVPEVYSCPIDAVFTNEDIPDYRSYPSEDCELCAQKVKIDGIVNSYGFSRL